MIFKTKFYFVEIAIHKVKSTNHQCASALLVQDGKLSNKKVKLTQQISPTYKLYSNFNNRVIIQ